MADKSYTTEEKIESYLNISIVAGAAADYILAAQKYIDEFTDRNFKADTEASARYYDGNNKQELIIDDCIEVAKVEIGSDMWGDNFIEIPSTGANRYYTLPTNNVADNVPIRKIGLRSQIFVYGNANNKITAKWGFSSSVPDDVSFAATVIAAGMYYANRGENTGPIKSERIGEYSVAYAEQGGFNDIKTAENILLGYKKYTI